VAAGLANVSINLSSMTDADQVAALQEGADQVRERAAASLAELETAFRARLARPS